MGGGVWLRLNGGYMGFATPLASIADQKKTGTDP